MRLGGPLFSDCSDPDRWIDALRAAGYRAAFCPLAVDADEDVLKAYRRAADRADIVIAEVGAWSNPISPDEETRRKAVRYCQEQLALADRIGALCCVNIAGACGEQWDGPHPDNLTPETFDRIVASVREIIDGVRPAHSFYTLETMPWMYPDSTESYRHLIEAIDRDRFAVHFDPVNLVCSPQRYFATGELIREFVRTLGPHIKSCHAKDILLSGRLTVHLDEARPGTGGLDYAALLREMSGLDPDIPLLLEHMAREEDYIEAARYIRSVAAENGIALEEVP
ncbi:MAG: sugar phosphate isomerase/epimerase [Armatimonadetes bacterium]|nr:sugar phosphate isomerase/epimerase [Armatimonadota bacterium]